MDPVASPANASVAIVGAGDFIGAAIARRFAAGGYRVHGGRRNGDQLAELTADGALALGRPVEPAQHMVAPEALIAKRQPAETGH